MISTNFFPNDPVPPVTSTACSDQFIPSASSMTSNLISLAPKPLESLARISRVQPFEQILTNGCAWLDLTLPASIADFPGIGAPCPNLEGRTCS